jgi:hypothetical protein
LPELSAARAAAGATTRADSAVRTAERRDTGALFTCSAVGASAKMENMRERLPSEGECELSHPEHHRGVKMQGTDAGRIGSLRKLQNSFLDSFRINSPWRFLHCNWTPTACSRPDCMSRMCAFCGRRGQLSFFCAVQYGCIGRCTRSSLQLHFAWVKYYVNAIIK